MHDQWRKAETRLVEHQEARRRHQCAAQRQHLAFAAGQRARPLRAPLGEAREALEDGLQAARQCITAQRRGVGAETQVVEHRQVAEELALLRHQAQSALDAGFDVASGQILALEANGALRRQKSDRGGEQCRLAGAVGSDHGDDLAGRERQRHAAHGLDLPVGNVEIGNLEHCRHRSPPRFRCPTSPPAPLRAPERGAECSLLPPARLGARRFHLSQGERGTR